MSYNESLNPNSNYPHMSQSEWDNAPWNEPEIPEKEFEVTVCQTLSRPDTVYTDKYIPCCDEGFEDGVGHHEEWADTSDTNWKEVANDNSLYTPLQLIQILETYVKKDFEEVEKAYEADSKSWDVSQKYHKLKNLLEQCDGWVEDDMEVALD